MKDKRKTMRGYIDTSFGNVQEEISKIGYKISPTERMGFMCPIQ